MMEPRSKKIEDWFAMIEQGLVKLPRFQRHEAWRPSQIEGLFENILRASPLPVGVLLTLEVGDKELFHSRPIVGAPDLGAKPMFHVLDGQQRMTALWRAMTNDYRDLTVFVSLKPPEGGESQPESLDPAAEPQIEIVKRWERKGTRQPVWADDPVDCLARGLVPLSVLRPGNAGEQALKEWRKMLRDGSVYSDDLGDLVGQLRGRLATYVLPFLSLPVGTSRETALEVFINMNTSASPLKDYDIVVAQVEEGAGTSLHDLVSDLLDEVPAAGEYGKIEDVILSISALLLDEPPLKKTYLEAEFGKRMISVWPQVTAGVREGLSFLGAEGMLNEKSLPSEPAVYLTCALWAVASEFKYDKIGNARTLIRAALWRACWTNRYGKTSATRAYADFKDLRKQLEGEPPSGCALFDDAYNPLPSIEEIKLAGWPGRKDRLPRAILATTLRRRALDFADGSPISRANVAAREYDHLFSFGFLKVDREDALVNRALNCALITSDTNRRKSAASPSKYFAERAQAAHLGEDTVRQRLMSHLVPFDELISDQYDAFLDARAQFVEADMKVLCSGAEPVT